MILTDFIYRTDFIFRNSNTFTNNTLILLTILT